MGRSLTSLAKINRNNMNTKEQHKVGKTAGTAMCTDGNYITPGRKGHLLSWRATRANSEPKNRREPSIYALHVKGAMHKWTFFLDSVIRACF